jgi:hypothetical protein
LLQTLSVLGWEFLRSWLQASNRVRGRWNHATSQ